MKKTDLIQFKGMYMVNQTGTWHIFVLIFLSFSLYTSMEIFCNRRIMLIKIQFQFCNLMNCLMSQVILSYIMFGRIKQE